MALVDVSEGAVETRWRDTALPVTRMRRQAQSALIGKCIQIAQRYNADYAIPLPGTSADTPSPALSPAIVAEAIDVPAIRASSTNPTILCPWLYDSDLSRKRATTRRKIIASTYHRSNFNLLKRRAYRQIAGYGFASLVVIPEEAKGRRDKMPLAKIAVRNALSTYADPHEPEQVDLPANVGFVHQISGSVLRQRYPRSREENHGVVPRAEQSQPAGELFDVLEWIDDDYVLIGIMGRSLEAQADPFREPMGQAQLLSWYPNRVGLVPAVVPQVITLDKLVSRLSHMIGKADLIAYLWQLDIEAMQRAIAPDRYVIAGDNEIPEIVSNAGRWMPGHTGEVNLLKGVHNVGQLSTNPDPNNLARIGQLTGNAKEETGLAGPSTGDSSGMAGALRTGKGIDSLMAASVDPMVAELQEVMGTSLTLLNEAIFATYAGYWPSQKFTVFSGWPSDRGMVEFTPTTDIEIKDNQVYYPLPGTDAYSQTVQLGQMVQAEMLSRDSSRRMHPWIDDADAEEKLLGVERIELLTWQALAQQASQGQLPPIDAASLIKHVRKGESIEDAIIAVQAEAQARQAGLQQDQQDAQQQAAAAQPGLSVPGMGAEAPPPAGGGDQNINHQTLMAALAQAPQNQAAQPGPSDQPRRVLAAALPSRV